MRRDRPEAGGAPEAAEPAGLAATEAALVLARLPIGIAIFDTTLRARLVNDAYCASLAVPPGSFPPGTSLESMLWSAAHRGLFGPGEPALQVEAALGADRSRPARLRRRTFEGRSFDLLSVPLGKAGAEGHAVCAIDITQLVAARAEADQRAQRMALVVSTLRLGLAAFTSDGALLVFNARFPELLGVPATALHEGMPFAVLIRLMRGSDEYASATGTQFLDGQEQLDRFRIGSARHVRPDGRVIDVASDPLPDGGWTMTLADISALAQAEDENARRVRMLHSIVDNIPHGITVYGADDRITIINQAYRRIIPIQQIAVGDHLEDMLRERVASGDLLPEHAATFPAFRREAKRRLAAWRRDRRDGSVLDVRIAPLPDGGHMSVITDVTGQVCAEREAQAQAAKLDAMIASTRHGIALFDRSGGLVASNPAAAELLELPPGDAATAGLQAHFAALADDGEGDAAVQRRLTTQSGHTIEVRADAAHGASRVLTYSDITPFLDAEQALRRARDEAEAASRAKTRFLATMSDEFRTPLNAVIGYADTLASVGATLAPERVKEFAEAISAAGQTLLGLVTTVLEVARLDQSKDAPPDEVTPLGLLIARALEPHAEAARAGGVSIAAGAVPDGIGVRGDPARLAKAIGQLISNAVKFTPGGGTVGIRTEHAPDGGMLVAVEDRGIGLAPGDLERVLEPFSQIDSGLDRRFRGAGLGLYTARLTIQAHGGLLRLRRRDGGGVVAEIVLPDHR